MRFGPVIGFAVVFGAVAAPSRAAVNLAGHHASYRLTLKSVQDQGVLAANGSMEYDLTDACSGWTTSQHLVINLTERDGQDTRMVSDYATYETKDGTRLTFHTRQMTGAATTSKLSGTAELDRSGGKGHADFAEPEKKRIDLPAGTRLPNAHTQAILQAGADGRRFLSMPLFDGTGADGAQDTFVTIENWQKPLASKWLPLSALPSGRVHVAFFDRAQSDELPDYETGIRYFNNGVADELEMDFGDFVMQGHIDRLAMKPPPRC